MKIINNITTLLNHRRELRNEATPQEALLWSKLKNAQLGVKFRRQHSIGGYITDFYCPSKKLVIEIDGSQHFEKENLEYDAIRTKYLCGLDIQVVRFTNGNVNTNLDGVILKIQNAITTPLPPPR